MELGNIQIAGQSQIPEISFSSQIKYDFGSDEIGFLLLFSPTWKQQQTFNENNLVSHSPKISTLTQ